MTKPKPSDVLYLVPTKKLPSTKAWLNLSLYARIKAVINLKAPKEQWICKCYTCENLVPFEKCCGGHFREKLGGNALYFDERNVRCQCSWNCNRMRHGNKEEYARKLVNEYGATILEDLFRDGQKATVYTKHHLNEIAEYYDKKIKELIQ